MCEEAVYLSRTKLLVRTNRPQTEWTDALTHIMRSDPDSCICDVKVRRSRGGGRWAKPAVTGQQINANRMLARRSRESDLIEQVGEKVSINIKGQLRIPCGVNRAADGDDQEAHRYRHQASGWPNHGCGPIDVGEGRLQRNSQRQDLAFGHL